MSKINEYPQAVTINNNDLFVIDQESGGDHATKSASVSQIADKATSGVQSQIGDLSQLTTSDKSSLVGAVNEVNLGKVNVSDLTPKTFSTTTPISIQANETVTQQFTVNNAKYGIITGFAITSNLNVVALQFYFYNATTVQVRVKNVSNANDVFHISFFYI